MNVAARRTFALSDKLSLQFRAEAFNLLNHSELRLRRSDFDRRHIWPGHQNAQSKSRHGRFAISTGRPQVDAVRAEGSLLARSDAIDSRFLLINEADEESSANSKAGNSHCANPDASFHLLDREYLREPSGIYGSRFDRDDDLQ